MFESILNLPATNFPLNPVLCLLGILEAFTIGFIVVTVYKKKHHSVQGPGFHTTMLLMAPLIALILMFIGSNLALSIGMVGALSIVRFRTIVKDPLDLMYLFLLIAVGLGAGTYNFFMTLVGSAVLLSILLFIKSDPSQTEGSVIIIRDQDHKKVAAFSQDFLSSHHGFKQERLELSPEVSEITLISESKTSSQDLNLNALKEKHGISHLSLYRRKSEY